MQNWCIHSKAYILEEVSNFTTKYYADNLPSVHNPPPRYNAGEDESMMIGVAVHAQLDALEVNDQGDHFLGYGEQHA